MIFKQIKSFFMPFPPVGSWAYRFYTKLYDLKHKGDADGDNDGDAEKDELDTLAYNLRDISLPFIDLERGSGTHFDPTADPSDRVSSE